MDALGDVRTIRYSRSAAAFRVPAEVMGDYYRAYRLFADKPRDPSAVIDFRLRAGDCVVFDNEPGLHGRSAYTVGHRHLRGCCADKDMLHSAIRVLETV